MTLPSYNHQSHRLRKLFLVLEYEHQTTVGTQVLVQLARVAEAGSARKAGLFPSERYQLENRLNSILKRCEVIVLEIEKHKRLMAEEDREREAYKKAAGRANERQKWRFPARSPSRVRLPERVPCIRGKCRREIPRRW